VDAPAATIMGAVVGAVAGISEGWITTRNQLRPERERWPRVREDAISQELRTAIQSLTVKLASALHSMAWLCWKASRDWRQVTTANVDDYDAEMHKLFPEMTGMLATVAALDKQSLDELNERYKEIVDLDRWIGDAGLVFRKNPESGGPTLGAFHAEIRATAEALPRKIADLVSERMTHRAALVRSN